MFEEAFGARERRAGADQRGQGARIDANLGYRRRKCRVSSADPNRALPPVGRMWLEPAT